MLREGSHPVAQVFLDRKGIVRVVHPEGAAVALEEVLRIQKAHESLAGFGPVPVLVDARGVRSMTLAARRAAAGPEVARVTSRLGILVDGPFSALVGNFFVKVSRPSYPSRVFTDTAAAERWLLDSSATRSLHA